MSSRLSSSRRWRGMWFVRSDIEAPRESLGLGSASVAPPPQGGKEPFREIPIALLPRLAHSVSILSAEASGRRCQWEGAYRKFRLGFARRVRRRRDPGRSVVVERRHKDKITRDMLCIRQCVKALPP